MKGWIILTVTLLVGIALGVVGTVVVPRIAHPYLPAALRGASHLVEAHVAGKRREPDRLLLKLETDRGSVLATFTKKVAEVDLLVDQGDLISIALPSDQAFVDDPAIERVKRPGMAGPASGPSGK